MLRQCYGYFVANQSLSSSPVASAQSSRNLIGRFGSDVELGDWKAVQEVTTAVSLLLGYRDAENC